MSAAESLAAGIADEDLSALLAALRRNSGGKLVMPRFSPDEGESGDAWLAQVARARADADAHAVRHRRLVDDAATRLFGTTAAELLPTSDVELVRSEFGVPVAKGAQLADFVPALEGVAPRGPGSRVAEAEEIRVSVTAPVGAVGAVVRLHGGAFWMGGGDVRAQIDGPLIDHIAVTTNAVVFDVDHRLAPEHPYPSAIIDVLCVLDAIRAGETVASPDGPVALMGTSSGSTITAVAARADSLRSPAVPLKALALIVPSMLLSELPKVLREDPAASALRHKQLHGYLGADVHADDPWVSPGASPVLDGMPPTFAAIAEYDEIAVGGDRLCAAIAAGGSPAEARTYPMTHTVAPPAVQAAMARDIAAFLRSRLAPR